MGNQHWYMCPEFMKYIGHNGVNFSNPNAKSIICPSDTDPYGDSATSTITSYCGNAYIGCGWNTYRNRHKISQIKKPSLMLGFAEGSGFYVSASTNTALNRYQDILEYRHVKRMNVVYVDGHIGSLTREEIPNDPNGDFWLKK